MLILFCSQKYLGKRAIFLWVFNWLERLFMKKYRYFLLFFFLFSITNVKAMTVNGFPNGFHICYTEDNLPKIKELYDYHQNGSKPILYSLNLKEMGEKTLINNDSFKDQTIIRPISYYGYLYPGHESGDWYIITQVALWQKLLPEANIYLCNEDKTK